MPTARIVTRAGCPGVEITRTSPMDWPRLAHMARHVGADTVVASFDGLGSNDRRVNLTGAQARAVADVLDVYARRFTERHARFYRAEASTLRDMAAGVGPRVASLGWYAGEQTWKADALGVERARPAFAADDDDEAAADAHGYHDGSRHLHPSCPLCNPQTRQG